ncbi:hypothetical protein JRO89_XS07G0009000 [Xanthoceras sorbifolium]|uniref:Uncharacterized protein n=1 Tax=Xanthoceras sorbifolium TaxID=99658 RepID=A0ABQ8HRM4_9ROSI|nr:hypothetical protein JRO89_XS07G0009000 [Xanthoceras sorbifolium]
MFVQSVCHPELILLTSSVEDQLNRLSTSQATSSSSFSSSVCQKLGGLRDLYENVDDLLQLPLTQQALSHEQHRKKVEEILDGSLRLVDVCGTTRDLFSQIKECVQELESFVRRKRGDGSNLADQKLGGFKELYIRIDNLLQLPLTQQAISPERHGKWAEDDLDGSLRLLDMCGTTTRDVFSQMKECVQKLESSLRRRKGGEPSLKNDIGAYMIS